MTFVLSEKKEMRILNIELFLGMILLLCLVVMGIIKRPETTTADGIFTFCVWIGSILSFITVCISLGTKNMKLKWQRTGISAFIFFCSILIGLYYEVTFSSF